MNDITAQMIVDKIKIHGIHYWVFPRDIENTQLIELAKECPSFKLFKFEDNRSMGYIATGLSTEVEEPVVVCCRNDVGYRNLMPALTEAYYRNIPLVIITLCKNSEMKLKGMIGESDITVQYKDILKKSICLPNLYNTLVNQKNATIINSLVEDVLNEIDHDGRGPVQIVYYSIENFKEIEKKISNLMTYKRIYTEMELPSVFGKHVAVLISENMLFDKNENLLIERFVNQIDAELFCNNTTNYRNGRYKLLYDYYCNPKLFDLLIILGNIVDPQIESFMTKETWIVNSNGEAISGISNISLVCEIDYSTFLKHYILDDNDFKSLSNFAPIARLYNEQNFNSEYIISYLSNKLPENYICFVGYYTFYKIAEKYVFKARVETNNGALGYDGMLSMALGASLSQKMKGKIVVVITEREFIHEMNVICNRHFGDSFIILMICNDSIGERRFEKYCLNCQLEYSCCINVKDFCNSIDMAMRGEKSILIECMINQ